MRKKLLIIESGVRISIRVQFCQSHDNKNQCTMRLHLYSRLPGGLHHSVRRLRTA